MSDRTVLGFDTSGPHCACAVLRGGAVLAETFEPMQRGQAERLMPLVEDVLRIAGLSWTDLDRIGVGTGPGNFTGLRIAISAARGLALGLDVRAVGVGSVVAYSDGLDDVCVALPAPRHRIHLGWGGRLVTRDANLPPPEGWPGRVTGPAAAMVAAPSVAPAPLAASIARLAGGASEPVPPPAPIYPQPADAAPPADPPPVILPH
ncbi:tRNA (adenosine(37)-N6)-threonylcarbamoyltransferase complex dimerization subunit type 1 TsaB [Jannaschia sp. LMIT008]|uniref:tRNA (adenosine(37)-N6)-threonylcarbamoyltransferase complex dimerization subunit type 1 TsaB n=1 Tax=Jannaschia maritima TaxID=3032585 RepID=UPI002811847C|nr:tRNA (adenosine(37)-N6)-threonylcarbamoyltransferase complex dimerization subunit type 1 TsaB [Jannaschia sp. LMIT008]